MEPIRFINSVLPRFGDSRRVAVVVDWDADVRGRLDEQDIVHGDASL